jgi:hypothetical protein
MGLNEFIKYFREITWTMWLLISGFAVSLILILYFVNIPTKGLETFIRYNSKKMVFGTDINHIPPSQLPQDGHLPSEIYYSFYCLLCVTALCSIQHIIIILLIIKIKPKDFVFEKNNNTNKNSSKPSSLLTQAVSVNESQPEIIP